MPYCVSKYASVPASLNSRSSVHLWEYIEALFLCVVSCEKVASLQVYKKNQTDSFTDNFYEI